ncbi:hypothetical protein BGW36DRAFT_380024 [Talaromyces proteolyticus]|uniref:PNPLA domain-containing protein n=1 Tax=Talaromyces proteolyticus TaxID=1131652 RepID=A0AAD4KSA6_9EURO|nr:uncharacterized protein BGW36DRAFT_380024 [Talaromyces proteolyticus]KAH8695985.1 hypothetical protein BGW36DRAFT_380024 [Talaromyces proteolyticus]
MKNRAASPAKQVGVTEERLSRCAFCRPDNPAQWRCDYCRLLFCDSCWNMPAPHLQNDPVHAKVSLHQHSLISNELSTNLNPESFKDLHAHDMVAVWFAISQDSYHGKLNFEEFPRFKHLVDEHQKAYNTSDPCYASLVSFVGVTGSGKSTLIKILMKRLWDDTSESTLDLNEIEVPVSGTRKTSNPTSGDVHLYRDPYLDPSEANYPLFYADCEGFGGGEVAPIGSKIRDTIEQIATSLDSASPKNMRFAQTALRWVKKGAKQAIDLKVPGGGFMRRQELVEKLFPRLLYNFSDVVVHVISGQSAKTMEHILLEVIKWAKVSESVAVNHPFLPHLIIVINAASDTSVWDPEEARRKIIQEQSGILKENQTAMLYAEQYEQIGNSIFTIEDLLHCFYVNVEFIYIPQAESGVNEALFLTQAQKLHEMVERATRGSQSLKANSKILLASEDQVQLFHLAFNHYTRFLDKPFDFLETLFTVRPLPHNFSNNVVRLLKSFRSNIQSQDSTEVYMEKLVPVLATIIALDVARSYRINAPLIDIFKGNLYKSYGNSGLRPSASPNSYEAQLQSAFEEFCEWSVPCSFVDRYGRKCHNSKRGHALPFHQGDTALPLAFGGFESKEVDELMSSWLPAVEKQIELLWDELESSIAPRNGSAFSYGVTHSILNTVWAHHARQISLLFQENSDLRLNFPLMCCFCFHNLPFEILPCGHSICDDCIHLVADTTGGPDSRVVCIRSCILHSTSCDFDPPHYIHLRPKLAGRRILALDGGGVRAIIELKILEGVEKKMGNFIPIQRFFDIIGGTSAGALVAFAIGIKDWRINLTEPMFRQICDRAFSNSAKSWVFKFIRGSQYLDGPFVEALKDALGKTADDYLIQARSESSGILRPAPKVFATATVSEGDGASVLPNYIRPHDRDNNLSDLYGFPYQFEVHEEQETQIRVWEAARCTTAAPTYFTPFRKTVPFATKYYDGGLYHNNPSKIALEESRRVWPEVPERHPDLLLSVGCGFSTTNSDETTQLLTRNYLFEALNVVRRRFLQVLNSERDWIEGFGVLSRMEPKRYIRLNPAVTERLPDLDDREALVDGSLERIVNKFLDEPSTKAIVDQVARRLIVTSFYLEPLAPARANGLEESANNFHGTIRCRFIDESPEIKAFADVIARFCPSQYADFDLQGPLTIGRLTPQLLQIMKTVGTFHIDVRFTLPSHDTPINITFSSPGFEAQGISGCPFLMKRT